MPQRMYDRVKETTTTTGTGDITLAGAVSQFKSFSSRFTANAAGWPAADYIYYAIVGQSGTEWEVGRGYLTNATTLVRDTVFSSSNADALVSFSAGDDMLSNINLLMYPPLVASAVNTGYNVPVPSCAVLAVGPSKPEGSELL